MRMLIAGGTGSLGEALVKEFYQDYEVTFTYNNSLEKAKELEEKYKTKAVQTLDLNSIEYNFDVVINNVGININPSIAEDIKEEDFEETLKVNVLFPFKMIKSTLPYMKENKYGRIVTISSVYAIKPEIEMASYNSSKSALEGLTKTIAKEYGEYGITANNILPSTFESAIMQEILKQYAHNEQEKKEYYDMLVKDSPIKRLVTVEEIAKLARFLISDDARFINGVSIPIDGGYSI